MQIDAKYVPSARHTFYSFDDSAKQLAVRQRQDNSFPVHPPNWMSPKVVLSSFPALSHIIDRPTKMSKNYALTH